MKTIIINNTKLELYDSIDEMPIVNFQKYNKYLLIDAGIGSDVDSVDSHIVNIAKYVNKGDKKNAMQELQNMRQNMHMIVSGVSPKYMAFATLIARIDGRDQKDLSDSHLQEILQDLNEVPHGFLIDILSGLKKKLSTELETYFPNEFDNAREKEAYTKLKERTLLQLQDIVNDTDSSDRISEIDDFLFGLYKPKNFVGKDSAEVRYDKQFESACMVISQETHMVAKEMTVLSFYSTLANISKQLEAKKKAYSKK